jgi:arylsulfatase A-like enzyme
MWNVAAYTHGLMGRTPNIDRIAKEGALLTDWYGEQSCTAGRANILQSAVKRFPRVLKVA